jgi:sugar phosphate isomerase/epimerase
VLIGAMNDARRPVVDELREIAARGYAFVDLTFEPPGAWPVEGAAGGRALRECGLQAVGHTPPYLPLASPIPELRAAARSVFAAMLGEFAAAGIALVNLHPDSTGVVSTRQDLAERNAEAIAVLVDDAAVRGLRLMVENLGRDFSVPTDLAPLFAAAPSLAFHLDVGHANMARAQGVPNRTPALLEAFGERLAHVHVHDNDGERDLHAPLGAGTVDWAEIVRELRGRGYDATVTIEVFAAGEPRDRSRELWRRWWDALEHGEIG